MGLDLHLHPVEHLIGVEGYTHTILPVTRGVAVAVHDAIRDGCLAAPALPPDTNIGGWTFGTVPDGHAKDEPYYGRADRDPYGQRYTWAEARDLLPFLYPASPAAGYVRALPPDTMIILGWR